jgi:hypothetical protein
VRGLGTVLEEAVRGAASWLASVIALRAEWIAESSASA